MPKPKPPVFTREYGRVITRDGKPWLLIATPGAFFNRFVDDGKGGTKMIGATPDEADKLADRIAFLLSEYGEDD